MDEFDKNLSKSEMYENNDLYASMSMEPPENFKELNADINFQDGTISTVGVDEDDLPFLLKTEKSDLIQELKNKVDNNEKIEPSFLNKMGSIVEGFKSWTMSAPLSDYNIAIDKASLQIGDSITQFNKLITGGTIGKLFDNQPRIFRLSQEGKADITIRATNSEVDEQFYNMSAEFRKFGKYHPFDDNGELKEGWQEITEFVATSDEIEYTNKNFTPAPFLEYGLAYGVPGVGFYKGLGQFETFKKFPMWIQVLLAETGVEFAMASQKKDDVNLGNLFKAFGIGDIDETTPEFLRGETSLMTKYINLFRESVAADLDDTAFERKWKNASGNAPIGVGLGLVLQFFKMAKKFKYNKKGREEVATNVDQEVVVDKGMDGEYKVYDQNGLETGGFKTQEEADEFAETLGEGFEAKSLGAAASPNEAPTTSVVMQGDTGLVKLNISDENLAISNYDRVRFDEGSERPFKVFLKGQENHQKSFTTQEEAENFINSDIANNKIIEENNARIRSKSEKPFYSNVEKAISNFTFKKQPGNQILATLNNTAGIKQSEIQDLGLDTFLKDNPSVTKEQLDDFIADKSLTTRVKETVLEGTEDIGGDVGDINFAVGFEDTRPDVLTNANSFDDAKLIVNNNEGLYDEITEFGLAKGISKDEMSENFDDYVDEFLKTQYGITQTFPGSSPTKFSDQTLPGGEDYKEILITAPGTPQVYTKHHFNKDVPPGENLIAHARFNTREINGKKTLFIEEIQSDLHQAGRKEGYNTKDAQKAQSEFDEYSLFLADKYDLNPQHNLAMYGGLKNMTDAEVNKYQLLQSKVNFGGVADAPFKKNWHELTMKRLIKYAVDNGFEAISLAPGKVQNARYDLSQVVNKIKVTPSIVATDKIALYTYDKKDFLSIYNIPTNRLEEYVGKELSEKIFRDIEGNNLFKKFNLDEYKSSPQSDSSGQEFLDQGLSYGTTDLEIGGKGMKGFYDDMLPKFLNKFGKKYNAKLETGSIGNEYSIYKASDIKENMPYTAIGSSNNTYAIYKIIFNYEAGMNGRYELTMKKDGNVQTIDFDPNFDKMKRSLAEELEGFKVPEIKKLNKIEVPFMVITPEMKKDILTEGVPIAQVEEQQEKNTALV
tara:strand:+ start:2228 stop:5569 length:3342 start_codon:yes stop_codon:yes gene_type:complete